MSFLGTLLGFCAAVLGRAPLFLAGALREQSQVAMKANLCSKPQRICLVPGRCFPQDSHGLGALLPCKT